MTRIQNTLKHKEAILSIYATAGYPQLNDTVEVLKRLQASGVDMIEVGLPFSDPLADGPTIQESSTTALENGMSTEVLFEQLEGIREHIHIPLIVMGYFNPVLQYGVEAFCQKCQAVGIDGVILPDLPLEIYQREYQVIFERYGLSMIFLITPQTSDERISAIEAASSTFIYMVSSASTTGKVNGFSDENRAYFKRIADMNLKVPTVVGFGIADAETFQQATAFSKGAIIGSAFIRHLKQQGVDQIAHFIHSLKPSHV